MIALYRYFPYWHPQGVKRHIDWAGVFTLILCIVPLLLALTWVTDYGWTAPRVELLLAFAAVMLGAFLYAETKAVEPLIPLSLFRDPVISMCSIGVFVLGVGMFGVIIYLPLFMQGVIGVSATQSGSLLTPLMLGVVFGTFTCGQLTLRLRSYKLPGLVGSVLVTAGMILFARMDASTGHSGVVLAMITSGFGMGLLIPVYTVAVQNAAPRKHMGAATASSTFFRSIGATVGVAIFGSLLLTNYHRDFAKGLPSGMPPETLAAFSNPLLLPQMRPQLEATFSHYENGPHMLQTLYGNVRTALLGGIRLIFLTSAVLMFGMIVLNVLLKDVPLRHGPAPASEPPAH
jgi:MFS family permease